MTTARLAFLPIGFILFSSALAHLVPSGRIFGGQDAKAGDFPYAVSLRLDTAHICGGSIIDKKHILTAAHCVAETSASSYDAKRVSVRLGSTNQFAGGKILQVSKVIIHPKYEDYQNDIAVVVLAEDLQFDTKINAIPIATTKNEAPPVGADVKVAGWGEQSSGETPYKLQSATFAVATAEACKDALGESDDSVICLAHESKKGSCRGDAGNGGVYQGKLVAVTNFVIGACGNRYPDIFANVVHFADWIKDVTK